MQTNDKVQKIIEIIEELIEVYRRRIQEPHTDRVTQYAAISAKEILEVVLLEIENIKSEKDPE